MLSEKTLSPTDELTPWGFGMKLRINGLCIIGVAIGVISLLAVWVMVGIPHAKELPPYEIHTGLELAFEMNTYWHIDSSVHVLFMLFAFGTLISLLTPLGSLIQVAAISYLYLNNPFPNSLPYNFQIGMYIGVLSSIVLFLSFLYPIGLNCQRGHLRFITRVLTVSKFSEQTLKTVESERHTRLPRIMKVIVAHRRKAIALLFSGLLIVPTIFIVRDYYTQPYGVLVVMVSSKGANSTGIMIIINGENTTGAFFGTDEYYHKPNGTILGAWAFDYGVVPGTCVVSFDFGIPSTWLTNSSFEPLPNSRYTDGDVDYSETVNVEPLRVTTVEVLIP